MKILAQKNIWQEHGYDRLLCSLRACSEVQEVHLVPFTTEFDEPARFAPDCVFGSNRFINVCRRLGYPAFKTFAPIEELYSRERWVNGDGYACRWEELRITDPVFLKPFTEKFFTGRVVESQEDLKKVQLATSFIDDEGKELIWISSPVRILQEVRLFCIHGTVVTGSVYKDKGVPKQHRIDQSHDAWITAKNLVAHKPIDEAFVIDMGLVDGTWKIVELNNFNSAGIYESDTDALANALMVLLD